MKINFLGNGSGFTDNHTNAYFKNNDDLVVIDLSMMHFDKVIKMDLEKNKNVYILVTHMHPDHVSGIGMLVQYCYYVLKNKITIIAPDILHEDMKTFLNVQGINENLYNIDNPVNYEWIKKVYKTKHAEELNCFGYMLNIDNQHCIYTGDTATLDAFKKDIIPGIEIYIDISYSYGGVHIKYSDVEQLLNEYAENNVKIYLMHIDNIKKMKEIEMHSNIQIVEIK